jgi:hypothetical protein
MDSQMTARKLSNQQKIESVSFSQPFIATDR